MAARLESLAAVPVANDPVKPSLEKTVPLYYGEGWTEGMGLL